MVPVVGVEWGGGNQITGVNPDPVDCFTDHRMRCDINSVCVGGGDICRIKKM